MKSGFIFRPTTSRSFERVSVKFFKGILFKRPIDSTKIARRKKIFPYILSNISHLYEGRIYFSSNISILRKKKGRDYLSLSIKRYKIIRSIVILRNIYLQKKRNLFKQRIDSTKGKKNISLDFISDISHTKGGFIFRPTTSRSFERASVKFFLSKEERSKLSIIKRSERYRLNVMKQFDPL